MLLVGADNTLVPVWDRFVVLVSPAGIAEAPLHVLQSPK